MATSSFRLRTYATSATVTRFSTDSFVNAANEVDVSGCRAIPAITTRSPRRARVKRRCSAPIICGTTDSAIWFHTPVRADEWNLLRSCSPAASAGRGLVTATLFGADGRPAATQLAQ